MKIIDVGLEATGVIAIGQISRGVVAVGQGAIGVVAIGQLAVGAIYGAGMLGIGTLAGGLVPIPLLGHLRLGDLLDFQLSPVKVRLTAWRVLLLIAAIAGVVAASLIPVWSALWGTDGISTRQALAGNDDPGWAIAAKIVDLGRENRPWFRLV